MAVNGLGRDNHAGSVSNLNVEGQRQGSNPGGDSEI